MKKYRTIHLRLDQKHYDSLKFKISKNEKNKNLEIVKNEYFQIYNEIKKLEQKIQKNENEYKNLKNEDR